MTTDTKTVARWAYEASHVGNYFNDIEVRMTCKPDGDYVLFADHERVVGELEGRYEGYRQAATEDVSRLRTALAASHAEVEGLKKDADRYRWLRDKAPEEWDVTRWLDNEHQEVHVQDYLDEAIDTAMEKGNE